MKNYVQPKIFKRGKIYKRSILHDQYGGNRQSGISSSARHPYIFVFYGASGEAYGYEDQWVNSNVFSYTGEGQIGDMTFSKGNLKLKNHVKEGRRIFLFNYVSKGMVRYEDELIFLETGFFPAKDKLGETRNAIKFFFNRLNSTIYPDLSKLNTSVESYDPPQNYGALSNKTERKGLVNSRIGQGAYRKSVMYRWEFQCAVSAYNNPKVLIASHILPWKDSSDRQRLDVNNGILLSPNYDALFDKNLISFDEQGNIMLSKELKSSDYSKLKVTGSEKVAGFTDSNQEYLEKHRSLLL